MKRKKIVFLARLASEIKECTEISEMVLGTGAMDELSLFATDEPRLIYLCEKYAEKIGAIVIGPKELIKLAEGPLISLRKADKETCRLIYVPHTKHNKEEDIIKKIVLEQKMFMNIEIVTSIHLMRDKLKTALKEKE